MMESIDEEIEKRKDSKKSKVDVVLNDVTISDVMTAAVNATANEEHLGKLISNNSMMLLIIPLIASEIFDELVKIKKGE